MGVFRFAGNKDLRFHEQRAIGHGFRVLRDFASRGEKWAISSVGRAADS